MSYLNTEIKKTAVRSLPPGQYTLDKIAKELQSTLTTQKVDLQTEINTPVGGMVIYNYDLANVQLGHNLSELLGIESNLLYIITDLQTELTNEADHYRQVAKKYKRTHSITHISAVGLGSISAGLSSATLATALTGFGIVEALRLLALRLFLGCFLLALLS